MNPTFRRDTDHNYMILDAPQEVRGDEYQVRMLVLNRIPGILSCKMRKMDGQAGFYYEITDLQPMARIFEKRKLGQKDIRALLTGLRKAMDGARTYLLDANQFLLDPEYIYMKPSAEEVLFCCLPFYDKDIGSSFRELAEYILKKLDHEDTEAVLWGYDIYGKAVEENYSIQQVLESVREKMTDDGECARSEEEEPKATLLDEFEEEPPPSLEKTEESGRKKQLDGNLGQERMENPDKSEENQKRQKRGRGKKGEDRSRELEVPQESAREKKKRMITLAAGLVISGAASLAGAFLGVTDLVQTGGIFFLGMGITVYGTRLLKRIPKIPERKPKMSGEYSAAAILWEEDEETCRNVGKDRTEEDGGFENETEVLSTGYNAAGAVLVSLEPEKRGDILLDKRRILVGKLPEKADAVIPLPVVSRVHACLEMRAEGWFLADENSRNGTYVNGNRLKPNQTKKLRTADKVYFANAGYRFQERQE